MIPGTYYVPDTYLPGISRQKSIRTYVMFLFLFPLFVSARHPHLFGNKSTWNFVYDRLLGAKKKTRRRFCTRRERFPRGLLNSWIFNFQTRYTAKTRYNFACLNIARPAADARPDQLQKRVLSALFHLRCPSQSHERSARGHTRLTTVTSISLSLIHI